MNTDERVTAGLALASDLRERGLVEQADSLLDLCGALVETGTQYRDLVVRERKFQRQAMDGSLAEEAIELIRKSLYRAKVPPAAYIDDHVIHVIVQRNKLIETLRELSQMVEGQTFSGRDQILQRIARGFHETKVDPNEVMNVEEAEGDS